MKNYSIKTTVTLLLMMLGLLATSPSYAQQHFEAGKTYTLRSKISEAQAIEISLTFNKEGVATLEKSLHPVKPEDQFNNFFFVPTDEIKSDPNSNIISLTGSHKSYFVIELSEKEITYYRATDEIKVTIKCTCSDEGSCSVQSLISGGTIVYYCKPESGCRECNPPVVTTGKNNTLSTGKILLVVKATALIY
ncbi:MAG: hypothetical protein MUC81_11345 [Bacteroidia bacterium]|jgi:hypothetical protein|nr:hypothetical protein [Bacteroidia bacterium]